MAFLARQASRNVGARFLPRLSPSCSTSSYSSIHKSSLSSPTSTALFTGLRCFAAASRTTDERVIGAVKKYLEERQQDMLVEMKEDGVKDDAKEKLMERIEMMKNEVSIDSKWSDFGLDDFDEVEVLLEVEEEFEKIINPDEEADKIKTVKQTVEWFDKAIKEDA